MPLQKEATFEGYLADYFKALYQTYSEIINAKADILVVPLRGAEPLLRGIQLIASYNKKSSEMPRLCFLKIGEIEKAESEPKHSFTIDEQQIEAVRMLGKSLSAINKKGPFKILLLDEASKGGSISKNVKLLEHALRKIGGAGEIKAISITEKGKPRCNNFTNMVRSGKINPIFVEKLLTTDKKKFLARERETPQLELWDESEPIYP